jgi:IclR family transcriptional regulator, mhp operon transcriptional activator
MPTRSLESRMPKTKVKTIRALSRGLEVLQIVQSAAGMSLNDIHRDTGLPKATLLRILHTLRGEGLIWQRIVDNAYLASYSLQENARHLDDTSHLVEVASPVLAELTRRVDWPSVLAVPRLDHMEVIETNSPRSYFDHIPLGPIGFQINMLMSATGRAYLAFCSETERAAILSRLKRSDRIGNQVARDEAWVTRILAATRKRGYGARDPRFGGDFDRPRRDRDDGRDSIAVPVVVEGRVRGVINLTWIQRVTTQAAIVKSHLGALDEAARMVAARLAARPPRRGRERSTR